MRCEQSPGGGGGRGSCGHWLKLKGEQARTGPRGQRCVSEERTDAHILYFDARGKGSLLTLLGMENNQVSSGDTRGREALANTLPRTVTAAASWEHSGGQNGSLGCVHWVHLGLPRLPVRLSGRTELHFLAVSWQSSL